MIGKKSSEYWIEKWTPALRKRLQSIWEWISFGILGLNSFIMLYYRSVHSKIQYVVCAGAVGYVLVLLLQSILYQHCPERRTRILKLTRKVFRLIYTAIYLAFIMMNIIVASQIPYRVPLMIYYGWVFIWVAIWGTNCFWAQKIHRLLKTFTFRVKFKSIEKKE